MRLQGAAFSFSALSSDCVLGTLLPCPFQACSPQPLHISKPLGPQLFTASLCLLRPGEPEKLHHISQLHQSVWPENSPRKSG